MLRTSVLLLFLLPFVSTAQYALSPLNEGHKTIVGAHVNSQKTIRPTALKPFLMPLDTLEELKKQNTERWEARAYESWFMRKLYNEHLVEVRKKDLNLFIDPVFNLQAFGQSDTAGRRMFINSRGIQLEGTLGKRLFFSSSFYENQAIYPTYLDSVVAERGSVPGYGRVKDFNTSTTYDYDYQMATGSIGYAINETSFIQFGHDRHFVGYGYRSLFLADGAAPYPFLRGSVSFWQNRITYSTTFAMRQQQERVAPNYNYKEALFSRDYWRFSVLEFAPWRWMNVHLFNAFALDDTYWWTYLPGGVFGNDGASFPDMNGLGVRIGPIKGGTFYAQMLGSGVVRSSGAQVGVSYIKEIAAFRLTALIEYNQADLNLYSSNWSNSTSYDYQHTGQFLGLQQGGFCREVVSRLKLSWRQVSLSLNMHYMELRDAFIDLTPLNVGIVNSEVAYQFNPKSNMQFLVGFTNRSESKPGITTFKNYTYVGFRTRLLNDFNIF